MGALIQIKTESFNNSSFFFFSSACVLCVRQGCYCLRSLIWPTWLMEWHRLPMSFLQLNQCHLRVPKGRERAPGSLRKQSCFPGSASQLWQLSLAPKLAVPQASSASWAPGTSWSIPIPKKPTSHRQVLSCLQGCCISHSHITPSSHHFPSLE